MCNRASSYTNANRCLFYLYNYVGFLQTWEWTTISLIGIVRSWYTKISAPDVPWHQVSPSLIGLCYVIAFQVYHCDIGLSSRKRHKRRTMSKLSIQLQIKISLLPLISMYPYFTDHVFLISSSNIYNLETTDSFRRWCSVVNVSFYLRLFSSERAQWRHTMFWCVYPVWVDYFSF